MQKLKIYIFTFYRILERNWLKLRDFDFGVSTFLLGSGGKHFHNRRVSSAPADTIVVSSLDSARCKTLSVWPVSSATFIILGYLHIIISLLAYPCADTSSLYSLDQIIEQTWEFVSILFNNVPLLQFHSFIVRSAVPPPLARILACHGHHANAFTAARC